VASQKSSSKKNSESQYQIDDSSKDIGSIGSPPPDIPQEHLEKIIEVLPEFHVDVMRTPPPKKIDAYSRRGGLFDGCGGARGDENSGEVSVNNEMRNHNMNSSS